MHRAKLLASHADAEAPSRPAAKANRIVVVGSCFMDYMGYVERLPAPGETVHSSTFAKGFGGKGANQAVAAARLGGAVSMVAAVGGDYDGAAYVQQLEREGVDTRGVVQATGSDTGLAMIGVDAEGRNSIVICPNAAAKSTPELLLTADTFKGAKAMVCQNEIPLDTTLAALKYAHEQRLYTVFNTAPAPTPDEVRKMIPFLRFVDLLCPNEHEAALLTGVKVTDYSSAAAAAQKMHDMGAGDVVITLGAQGAAVFPRNAPAAMVPGVRLRAVDTTGAGDCFVGALVRFHVAGDDLVAAATKANTCAAQSVLKRGTQASYPTKASLPKELFDR